MPEQGGSTAIELDVRKRPDEAIQNVHIESKSECEVKLRRMFMTVKAEIRKVTPKGGAQGATDRPRVEHIEYAIGESSLGYVLVARSGRGVCALLLGEHRPQLRRILADRYPTAVLREGRADLIVLTSEITAFIEVPMGNPHIPLDLCGTPFQQTVWQALLDIPSGQRVTYAELAKQIGRPKSFRAVAQACAANRVAVLVPCHRVVRSDGSLSGYRWGAERKRVLLERERVLAEQAYTPERTHLRGTRPRTGHVPAMDHFLL